ncbi:MAG: hypothetical protein Q9161_006989 [Pseudevernia consocians]
MKILVKGLADPEVGGHPLRLELDLSPQDTVATIKSRIEEETGLPYYNQTLFCAGKRLQDQKATLFSFDMRDNEDGDVYKVILTRANPPEDCIPFQLEVRTRDTFMIEVRPRDTMQTTKETIQRAKGWKASELDLPFEDDVTVAQSGLDEYSTLLLCGKKGTEMGEVLGGRSEGGVRSPEDRDGEAEERRRKKMREKRVRFGEVRLGGWEESEEDEDEVEDEDEDGDEKLKGERIRSRPSSRVGPEKGQSSKK